MNGLLYELTLFWNWITYPLNKIGFMDDEIILLIILIIVLIRYLVKRRTKHLHANWNTLIDGFSYSTPEFYILIEKEILRHGISDITIKEVNLKESHSLSSRRKYLRIQWREYTYDCCLAPFGNGTFVSWWFYSKRPVIELIIASLLFIGRWLASKLYRQTYYTYDTASMFRSYVEQSFHKVIEDITKDTGYRLASEDRKPHIRDMFKR